jgi:hypothetical protein
MTKLLEQALREVEQLPAAEQDAADGHGSTMSSTCAISV